MRFSEIQWWPDQVAHFGETFSASMLGWWVGAGDPKIIALAGFVQAAGKEGEDMYYKAKEGKFAAGDVLDLVIHLFGVSIPYALAVWFA